MRAAWRAGGVPRVLVAAAARVAVATAIAVASLWPGELEARPAAGLVSATEAAEVVAVRERLCGQATTDVCRRVTVRLRSGPDEGSRAVLQLASGELDPRVRPGDGVRVVRTAVEPGTPVAEAYALSDLERRTPLLALTLAFALVVIAVGRLRGALSLGGLGLSLAVVLAFVVPAILGGAAPLPVALAGSMAIMLITISLSHGLGAKALAAILGTAASLLLTTALAVVATDLTSLTGLGGEETTILQGQTDALSLRGLLVAGMVIGALGVLDDVSMSQSSTVMALRAARPLAGAPELFFRAMEVGRDHVAATVNTLVLAYVGASLPLLLLFSSGELGFVDAVTLEVIAQEVVATVVGSIGLIAAVPLTTGFAALLARHLAPDDVTSAGAAHVHA